MKRTILFDINHIINPIRLDGFLFYQTGTKRIVGKGGSPEHKQYDFIELTAVTDGVGRIYANDIATTVSKGDIFVSFPGDSHCIVSSEDNPLKYHFVAFQPTTPTLSGEFDKIYLDFDERNRVIHDDKIVSIIDDIIVEISDSYLSNLVLPSLLTHLSVQIIRAFRKNQTALRNTPNNHSQLCNDIIQFVNTHIYSIKKLSDLELAFNYNYSYLSNIFKSSYGFTINDYFRRVKMATANKLIQEKTLSLTEIASLLNYSSLYAFSNAYKSFFGISPQKTRKSIN